MVGRRGLAAIAVAILVPGLLGGCRTTAPPRSVSEAGTAGPRNERQRLGEIRWARATDGLTFGGAAGRVEVRALPGGSSAAAEAHLASADELLGLNRVMQAMEQYTLAARNDPQRAEAYVGLGITLQQKGKTTEAIAAFRTAVDRDERRLDARYRLALALWSAMEQDQALQEMNGVLTLDGDYVSAHERLAVWNYYVEDYTAAWRHLHRAQALGGALPAQLISLLQTMMSDPDNSTSMNGHD